VILPSKQQVTYYHLCYDTVTNSLYSLQKDTPISPIPPKYGSRIVRMDARTGATSVVAYLKEDSLVGDCYGGYYFVISKETQLGDYLLYNVDLTTGNVCIVLRDYTQQSHILCYMYIALTHYCDYFNSSIITLLLLLVYLLN
jgi:hypothetical protein